MDAILPKFFATKKCESLVRLGRSNDGGYLVCETDIKRSDFLLGFGLSDDWSFEADFLKVNDVITCVYDGSVDTRFFIKRIVIELCKTFSLKGFINYFNYLRFFRGQRRHVKKFVGLDGINPNDVSFDQVMLACPGQKVFIKMDIEGAEYRCLGDIINHQDRISGMVIEFHDCDLWLAEIESFISQLSFDLVHVHANNCSPVRAADKLPVVLELTFSRSASGGSGATLPHPLDQPNNFRTEEIRLSIDV